MHQLLAASERAWRRMRWSQPLIDGRYQDSCLVADREFVVPRGHGAVSLEAIDAALDCVPTGERSARPQATHADLLQYGFKLRRVATLPGRDHDRHWFLALLDGQVQLGGQAATRASEPVVVRLGGDATGRFDLQAPLFRAPAACW
ncbi:hypothetical protein ACFYY8_13155 [Streptosporangium sp. NPDC001559]|uniref:hypothetical protein n=1 Tax=Streptosporangium sp. NPDC001559 TaxID=3366187 RepID=UPI0036E91358